VTQQPFSHLDLAPTVLDALDLPIPVEFQGTSRWGEWQRAEESERVAIIESADCSNPNRPESRLAPRVLCVRGARHKMIVRFPSGRADLFDLERDPGEKNPLPESVEPQTRAKMLQHSLAHLQKLNLPSLSELQLRARMLNICRVLPNDVSSTEALDVNVVA